MMRIMMRIMMRMTEDTMPGLKGKNFNLSGLELSLHHYAFKKDFCK